MCTTRRGRARPRSERGDPAGCAGLRGVRVQDVAADVRAAAAQIVRVAEASSRGDSSRGSSGRCDRARRARSARCSIDASPGGIVPATTSTSWPSRCCPAASSSTESAAPPTFRRAIACTIFICRRSATPPYDSPMRIVFLTGIWPPDVGGPATHGPDFARFLRDRGHDVRVVTMADSEPTERPVPVQTVARGPAVRHSLSAGRPAPAFASRARPTSSTRRRRTPLRPPRRPGPAGRSSPSSSPTPPTSAPGATACSAAPSRSSSEARDPRSAALRRLRTTSLRRARRIVVPSRYLAEIAGGWGLDRARIEVLVNPAPPPADVEPAPLEPGTFVFVGRLTHQKALPVAAARRSPRSTAPGSSSSAPAQTGRRSSRRSSDARARRPRPLRRRAAARRGARAARGRARRRSLERLGEPAARRSRGACRRHARRLDRGRRRSGGRARRRERPARPAERSRGAGRRPARGPATTTRCGIVWPRPRSRRWPRSAVTRSTAASSRSSPRRPDEPARAVRRARPALRCRWRRGCSGNGMRSRRCSTCAC